jgi:hypothetical protein
MTFEIGWLVVLIGVAAMQWSDGRFPFARSTRHEHVYDGRRHSASI